MSKGLEALERIGKRKYKTTVANITGFETISISVKQDNRKDYNIIEKELKALDIIKNKQIDIWQLRQYMSFNLIMTKKEQLNEYNKRHATFLHLTQEEYDLLKEILL